MAQMHFLLHGWKHKLCLILAPQFLISLCPEHARHSKLELILLNSASFRLVTCLWIVSWTTWVYLLNNLDKLQLWQGIIVSPAAFAREGAGNVHSGLHGCLRRWSHYESCKTSCFPKSFSSLAEIWTCPLMSWQSSALWAAEERLQGGLKRLKNPARKWKGLWSLKSPCLKANLIALWMTGWLGWTCGGSESWAPC